MNFWSQIHLRWRQQTKLSKHKEKRALTQATWHTLAKAEYHPEYILAVHCIIIIQKLGITVFVVTPNQERVR